LQTGATKKQRRVPIGNVLATKRRGELAGPVAQGSSVPITPAAETPEFQRQSRDFAAAVKSAGFVMEGYNHFEVWEQLVNPYSLLGRAVLEQMKLRPT